MTSNRLLAFDLSGTWRGFWEGDTGVWILARGVPIALLLIGALLAARFINWAAQRITRRIDAQYQESDQLVRTESAKHRQAVASVISWVSVALLFVMVSVQITDILAIPIGSLVAPAAVIGAALGFGAQKLVQDLLAGFFIITERQYGFGDLVQLNMVGAPEPAQGTVEEVTLRVTKLRTSEGEVFTVPNGNIVQSLNMSKDWARAVVDIPVPTSVDLNSVNEVLHTVGERAMRDVELRALLLDTPQLMGVESIQVDTVNLRMVARTLPGKQFEVGRRLRILIIAALAGAGIATKDHTPTVSNISATGDTVSSEAAAAGRSEYKS
ncbi:mechanosensitive ion channel family protein [Mycolicibacterium austroafricanum]|uniref:mechanosensitive ion channel family protein n=1 Tax=Mycolicibacterium austroafricanum TaxID=39687 RepID=UPI001CA3627F|nr:mechanosensitive ion channel family protein [Mycolicibacterium austroafricanum]QZT63891.1 mechanosensitive ion channel family protein [Mycolicibacterium austroafricanum]